MALEWLVDYVPGWLGPTAVFIGLVTCSVGLFRQSKRRLVTDVTSSMDYVLLSVVGVIFFWAVTSLLKTPPFFIRYTTVYAAVFMFAAKWIEGVGAVSLYQKASYVFNTRSLPGGVSLQKKVVWKLVLILLGVISSYAIIGGLLFGPISFPVSNVLIVVWTVATFLTSVLGLTWKVSRISGSLPAFLLYGTLLMLAGVEVVNLVNIAAEIRVFVAGGVGYFMGYLVTIILWLIDY